MHYDDDEQPRDLMDSVLLLVKYTRDEQLEDEEQKWKQTKRGTFYRIDSQYDNVIHIYT